MQQYPDKLALWDKVRTDWPQAKLLTEAEVIKWAWDDHSRLRCVVLAIEYPGGVWYGFPNHPVMGYRFGLEGPDYISGFSSL